MAGLYGKQRVFSRPGNNTAGQKYIGISAYMLSLNPGGMLQTNRFSSHKYPLIGHATTALPVNGVSMMEYAMEHITKRHSAGTMPSNTPRCFGMPNGCGIFRATIALPLAQTGAP